LPEFFFSHFFSFSPFSAEVISATVTAESLLSKAEVLVSRLKRVRLAFTVSDADNRVASFPDL
jgi:hypothetical protein